jgi:hypothetical protein
MLSNGALGRAATARPGDRSACAGPLTGGTVFHVPRERASVSSLRKERASVAALVRHHPDNPEVADAGRRRLKVLKARRLIRSLVAEPPVLSIEQRAELAVDLLRGAGGDGDDVT